MKLILKTTFYIFMILIFLNSCTSGEFQQNYKIGFSQAMTTDNWRREMNRAMEIEVSMYPDIGLEIRDSENNIQLQISQIEKFIEEGVNVLIVSPIQSIPLTPVIEKAMNAGIPTIIIDRKISGSNFTAYLGANNIEIGKNAGRYIISHLKDSANILEIKGLEGSSPAYERSQGFNEVLRPFNNIRIIGIVNGDWEKTSVKTQLNNLLDSIVPPNYIFAHNDRMALGAWEVLKSRSLEDQIKIIGVDGLFGPNEGIQFVKDNLLAATILYPTGGTEAIKLARQILDGKSVSKTNILSTVVIDSVNVDIMQNQFDKMNQQQNDIEQQQAIVRNQIKTFKNQNNLIKVMTFLLMLLLSLAIYSIYSVIIIKKSKRKLELNNQKITIQRNQIENFAQKLKISNEYKINFFTALSHEFKTPLTLITSSIESIANNRNLKDFSFETKLISNNSKRLLRLINELLDFRKLESNSFQIKPVRTNLHRFIESIYKDFKTEAIKKSIEFELRAVNPELEIYIDRNMMDKVFFNLLSNAFKFTPNNGKISILIEDASIEKVKVIIKDSGIGIPREENEKVFEPFIQATNNIKSSSGLGLFITKQFVELHMGEISVTSKQGSEFSISLLKGKNHFKDLSISEKMQDLHVSASNHIIPDIDMQVDELMCAEREDAETILIIEDNDDLALLLKRKLNNDFNVHISDGTDGIEKALEIIPDIIICDINLPEKSGFEICTELKADLRTSHIPTLILTALSDEESRIIALKAGADSFMTKPFNFEVLKQSLISLLYNREKLRYYYTNKIDQVKDEKFNNSEQVFLKKLNAIIADNLKNPDFSVEELAHQLNISRVQLYRKVKALIGLSISEYINSQRLSKAKSLLQDSTLNISEIAYSVGYSSPGYFSTSFKNKYGISPKSFKI
ncbi:substrate-binding domain-containing protein [Marivirga sp.]|uniref:substrate-binding domain-containing protein n=1 Tax=Marivirga sp. TaxID=2018662 RepID=UPI0025CC1CD9|nr:substrate-binding domain-containing protein [Marivirga sp.]